MAKKIEVFQKLMESVKKNCPGLISEDVENQMTQEFDSAISGIEDAAKAQGQKDGFEAGYAEGKRIAGEKAQADLQKIIDQCDQEAVEKVQQILELIDCDNTAKLEQIYQMLQDAQAETDVALQAQDEEYAQKLEEVYTAKDEADAAKLEQVATAMDADYAAKLEEALNAKDEADAAKLQTYAEAVDKKHAQQIEEAVKAIDKKHALVMEQVIKEVDENNAKKLEEAIKIVKESANKRMQKMQTIYEEKIKAEKDKKVDILAESVEKYLNYALESHLPKKQLVSEQKYAAAVKTLGKITDYLKVNSIIQESKEEVFSDYEKQLANAKSEQNKLISEKIELTDRLNKKEAQVVLESAIKQSTPAQAKFLREYFKHANSPRIIEESIEDARASFRRIQSEKRAKLQAGLKGSVSNKPSSVVTQAKTIRPTTLKSTEVKESPKTITEQTNDIAQFYANYLKRK